MSINKVISLLKVILFPNPVGSTAKRRHLFLLPPSLFSPGKCRSKIPGLRPVRTLCIDRLKFRLIQRCKSLTYLPGPYDGRLLRTGKVSVPASDVRNIEGKNLISSRKRNFRNAEKFINISENTKTRKIIR